MTWPDRDKEKGLKKSWFCDSLLSQSPAHCSGRVFLVAAEKADPFEDLHWGLVRPTWLYVDSPIASNLLQYLTRELSGFRRNQEYRPCLMSMWLPDQWPVMWLDLERRTTFLLPISCLLILLFLLPTPLKDLPSRPAILSWSYFNVFTPAPMLKSTMLNSWYSNRFFFYMIQEKIPKMVLNRCARCNLYNTWHLFTIHLQYYCNTITILLQYFYNTFTIVLQ